MSFIRCPSCGRRVNSSAINCGFCGHRLGSGSESRLNSSPDKKQCPNCGQNLNSSALNCGFCGYYFGKKALKSNKKVYSEHIKIDKPKVKKSKVNKVTNKKHFDDGIVSFDYPDFYSKDFNSNYSELGILASFKTGSNYNYDSAFAIFDGEPISNKIPDSKFKEVIKKSLDSDVLNINRYYFGEKERIIIKTLNDNIQYRCYVPEIGFSVLFVIPDEKESLFDEKCISTVVNSIEKSTGKSIDEEPVSTVDDSSKISTGKSIVKKEIKTCTNCGFENPDDSNFCMECGMKLDISNDVNFCIHCGTEIIWGAKFCMNCGKLIEY